MTVAFESPAQPDIVRLIDELDAYQKPLYPPESHHGIDLHALLHPDVLFAVVRDESGEAVGCGAVLLLDGYGELKRMYLRPAARGRGYAVALLRLLEDAARDRGCAELALETGVLQHAAIAFYEREGYERCAPFGDYRPDPLSLFMRKRLMV